MSILEKTGLNPEDRVDYAYMKLVDRILKTGEKQQQRAKLKDGRKPYTLSIFGESIKFDMNYTGVISCRRVPFKSVVGELAWFLRGDTNVKWLQERGVTIWDEWADESGELGPIYGKTWRDFNGVDQILKVEKQLLDVANDPNHPSGRRIVLTSWNPAEQSEKAPTGCHTLSQYSIRGEDYNRRLDCVVYMRSCDVALGLPFNMASYWLLVEIFRRRLNSSLTHHIKPGVMTFQFGDCHIYDNHIEAMEGVRDRYVEINGLVISTPNLWMNSVKILPYELQNDLRNLEPDDFELSSYRPQPGLKLEIAV